MKPRKSIIVTVEARKNVSNRALSASITQARNAIKNDEPVGFVRTLSSGIQYLVKQSAVMLF